MKVILFICGLYLIMLIGCTPGYEVEKSSFVYGYDFTKYSALGFLFTPEPYSGNYESIGLIEIVLYPEVKEAARKSGEKKYDTWETEDEYRNGRWIIKKIPASEVLDSLYSYTKDMGADAVVNLIIEITGPISNREIYFTGIKASGFAIKRK